MANDIKCISLPLAIITILITLIFDCFAERCICTRHVLNAFFTHCLILFFLDLIREKLFLFDR